MGNQIATTDHNGRTRQFTYDGLNRYSGVSVKKSFR
ncbi:MAG: hypothetical protein AB4426_17080 [Xenococcaceae cyanobacterium]